MHQQGRKWNVVHAGDAPARYIVVAHNTELVKCMYLMRTGGLVVICTRVWRIELSQRHDCLVTKFQPHYFFILPSVAKRQYHLAVHLEHWTEGGIERMKKLSI